MVFCLPISRVGWEGTQPNTLLRLKSDLKRSFLHANGHYSLEPFFCLVVLYIRQKLLHLLQLFLNSILLKWFYSCQPKHWVIVKWNINSIVHCAVPRWTGCYEWSSVYLFEGYCGSLTLLAFNRALTWEKMCKDFLGSGWMRGGKELLLRLGLG